MVRSRAATPSENVHEAALRKLREERQERLENYDLGGVYDEINSELNDLVDAERPGAVRVGADLMGGFAHASIVQGLGVRG